MPTTQKSFREATGTVRPKGSHGCPPAQIIPGLWTATYHDIDTPEKLASVSPSVTVVINAACDKCPPINYGPGVELIEIPGLLDDPDALKKVDAMEDGAGKDAARKALPVFPPEECAGDAKKDFEKVNGIIDGTLGGGGEVMVHCHASLSRSVVFILAYLMKTKGMSPVEAVEAMKDKWGATWPNDTFVGQIIEYEAELAAAS